MRCTSSSGEKSVPQLPIAHCSLWPAMTRRGDKTRMVLTKMSRRLQPRMDLVVQLQNVAEQLLKDAGAMRTNIRVQTTNDHNYPVLAEALADGAFSLTGGMSMLGYQGGDIHNAPTVSLMRTTGATIVQSDTRVDPPLVPIAREFGGQAGQMLAPLHHAGAFCGFIAVHGDGEPRRWTEQDQSHLHTAVTQVETLIADAPWFERPDPTPLRHLLVVLSDPEDGREEEYNNWYSGQHLRETLQTPGWSSAQRFVLSSKQISEHLPEQKYLALYEISADESDALAALKARSSEIASSDAMSPADVVALFTPITDRIEPT